jgi:hypothetical protein
MSSSSNDEAMLNASFNVYDRIWLHVRRNGSEVRYNEFPDGGRTKSVYVIKLPNGETVERRAWPHRTD